MLNERIKELRVARGLSQVELAEKIGIYGSAYTNTMMVELGERLHFAAGSDKNIKLTTKDDLEMFKAYLKTEKDSWLK